MDDEMDMGMDDEMDAPEGDMELSDDEAQAIIDLADKLRAAMGDEGAGEEEADELAMDDEPELDAPEGGDDLEMGAEDEEEPMMEEEDLVAEVAKRVAARLQSESKKEQIVDQLAERILSRLSK
jgi:hypothetical protein